MHQTFTGKIPPWTEKELHQFKSTSDQMFFFGAILLMMVSSLRFIFVANVDMHEVTLNLYYLALGILTGMAQLKIMYVKQKFRFLSFYWGKAIFALFLASMNFSTDTDVEELSYAKYLVAAYFMSVAWAHLVLAIIDRTSDKQMDLLLDSL